jgi:glycosidase
VKVARDDDRSLLGLYRELLLLRRESVALHSGDYEPLIVGDGVFGFFRRADSESYLVLLNFTDQPATAKVLDGFAGTIAISTSPGRRGNAVSGKSIELLPAEGSVIRLT